MKNTLILLILLILPPVSGIAQDMPLQDFPGMTQVNMQKIQEMQKCMASVEQKKLQEIEQLQNKFDAEIEPLCASGKRDQAQQKAITYAKTMMDNPAIKAMLKCGEIAKDMMPDMPFMDLHKDMNESMLNEHICDSY